MLQHETPVPPVVSYPPTSEVYAMHTSNTVPHYTVCEGSHAVEVQQPTMESAQVNIQQPSMESTQASLQQPGVKRSADWGYYEQGSAASKQARYASLENTERVIPRSSIGSRPPVNTAQVQYALSPHMQAGTEGHSNLQQDMMQGKLIQQQDIMQGNQIQEQDVMLGKLIQQRISIGQALQRRDMEEQLAERLATQGKIMEQVVVQARSVQHPATERQGAEKKATHQQLMQQQTALRQLMQEQTAQRQTLQQHATQRQTLQQQTVQRTQPPMQHQPIHGHPVGQQGVPNRRRAQQQAAHGLSAEQESLIQESKRRQQIVQQENKARQQNVQQENKARQQSAQGGQARPHRATGQHAGGAKVYRPVMKDGCTQTSEIGTSSETGKTSNKGTFVITVDTATGKTYTCYLPKDGSFFKVVPVDWIHRTNDAVVVKQLSVEDEVGVCFCVFLYVCV